MVEYICKICGTEHEPEVATGCRLCSRCEAPIWGSDTDQRVSSDIAKLSGARFTPTAEPEIGRPIKL